MADPLDDKEVMGAAGAAGASSAEAIADESPAADQSLDPDSDAVATLLQDKAALQDRLLRLAAEFENYRKRVERDRRDHADAAVAGALEDLLPIIDNLERALEVPAGTDADVYRKGVELIHQQMVELLRKRGVTPIETVGTDFDPRIHQAVAHDNSSEHREGEVMEEFRRGYKIGERLIRPAMVKVAKT
jgi:molecular chaperone GrpE